MKITPREKRRHAARREKNDSPRLASPFLAWDDFHARSRFARSTISEEKWGTTRSLARFSVFANRSLHRGLNPHPAQIKRDLLLSDLLAQRIYKVSITYTVTEDKDLG